MTRSPSGLASISFAKRAPVILQAAEQITSRATPESVVRAISLVASVTAAMLTTSFRVSSWLTWSSSARFRFSAARSRSCRTSDCTVKPTIGAMQIQSRPRVHSLDGYSGAPTSRSGVRKSAATPTMLSPSSRRVPYSASQKTGSMVSTL